MLTKTVDNVRAMWCILSKTVTMLEWWCMLTKTFTMLEL